MDNDNIMYYNNNPNTINNLQNQCQRQQVYDGSVLLQYYNDYQWQSREAWYVNNVKNIILPRQPDTKTMQLLESNIDFILTQALIDTCKCQRERDKWKTEKDLREKEVFVIQKQLALQPPANGACALPKPTEKEIQGLTVAFLRKQIIDGGKNIYQLLSDAEYRYTFMNSVVSSLKEKKSSLIADVAAIKIEAHLSGNGNVNVTSNVNNYKGNTK